MNENTCCHFIILNFDDTQVQRWNCSRVNVLLDQRRLPHTRSPCGHQANIFIADFGTNQIWKATASGDISMLAGDGTKGIRDGEDVGLIGMCLNKKLMVTSPRKLPSVTTTESKELQQMNMFLSSLAAAYKRFQDGNVDQAQYSGPYGIDVDCHVCWTWCERLQW